MDVSSNAYQSTFIIPAEQHGNNEDRANKQNSWRKTKRPLYLSLSVAVHDDSQPDFDPERLYPLKKLPTSASGSDDSFSKSAYNSPSLFPNGLPKPPRKHPFAKDFEAPNWKLVLMHILLCLIAYPISQIFMVFARGKTLFWTRLLVGAGCGFIGFILGLSLLRLGRSIFEACTWATVIHLSRVTDGPGVKLKDLAVHTDDSTSSWSALRLLWDRHTYSGAARDVRRNYDRRPWTLYVLFFLVLIGTTASLPFILGRIVRIETYVRYQVESYTEVAIKGDVSDVDIARANSMTGAFESFIFTWTLSPFSTHGGLPPVVTFEHEGDTVYFSETILSQLLPGGSGFGTFDDNSTAASTDVNPTINSIKVSDPTAGVEPGSILRYPKWGIRIKCATVPDGDVNIVPRSLNGFTYLFTPRSVLRTLFDSFEMDFLAELNASVNMTDVLQLNDTAPPKLIIDDTVFGVAFYDNGVAHSLKSIPLNGMADGKGWITLESVLIRLNTSYAPEGKFPVLSESSVPDVNGTATHIGYDAAICLELYEPWVVEVYNSSVSVPSSLRIVEKAASISDMNTDRLTEKIDGPRLSDSNVKRQLNSTNLVGVYTSAHQNSVNQILKDNGRDSFYVPSPTIVSFSGGIGPLGYTQLSTELFAKARALADSSNVLPYFVGTGDSLARRYSDRVLSSAEIEHVLMAIALAVVLILGLTAALFVPKLPLGTPRRGFEIYSWLAAFYADELVSEKPTVGIGRKMDLDDIVDHVGNLKFKYVS
ncbi:hypothetical protein BDQ12DRAFT_596142 [Crucibulum laeve]|uniref:Uncharacterized protein n=1 Tax=Crucibulum laeve TaxID=68775 RepID=A0A5C3MC78_9AGAR|nr:hypothetical protein BDQ12DRAFT_596142 [Crucibulum laeve]